MEREILRFREYLTKKATIGGIFTYSCTYLWDRGQEFL